METQDRPGEYRTAQKEGCCVLDRSGERILEADRRFAAFLGKEREELVGKPLDVLLERFDQANKLFPVVEGGTGLLVRKADGGRFLSKIHRRDQQGELLFLLKPILGSAETFSHGGSFFYELSQDLFMIGDLETRSFLSVNPSFYTALGYSEEDLYGKELADLIHPEDREAYYKSLELLQEGRSIDELRLRGLKKNGEWVWYEWSAFPDTVDGLLYAIGRKVEEEVRSKEALQRSEDWYHRLFDASPIPMMIHDGDCVEDLNLKTLHLLGLEDKEVLLGKRIEDVYTIKDGKLLLENLKEALKSDEGFEGFETSIKCGQGIPIEVSICVSPVECFGKRCLHIAIRDIREEKRMERELKRSEEEYRSIVESIPEGIHMLAPEDREGSAFRVEFVNDHFAETRGFRKEELIGRDLWSFLKEKGAEEYFAPPRKAFLENRIVDYGADIKYEREERSFEARAIPIQDAEGNCVRIVVISRDVTERKRVERELERREAEYRTVVEGVPMGLFMLSPEDRSGERFRFEFVNGGFLSDRNMERGELIGKDLMTVLKAKNATHLFDHQQKAFQEQVPLEYEQELKVGGEKRCFRERVVPVMDEKGDCVRLIGTSQDITEEKEREKERERLALISRETQDSVLITDQDGLTYWVNDAFTWVTGYTLEDIQGLRPGDLLQGPDSDPKEVEKMRKAIEAREKEVVELINYTKEGSTYWIRIAMQPIFDQEGELEGFFSIQTDVTERRMMEEQLRQNEKQFRLLVENMNEGIMQLGPDYKVEYVNDNLVQKLGYRRKDVIGQDMIRLTEKNMPENLEQIRKIIESRKKGESGQNEFIVPNSDGVRIPFLVSGSPLFDESGKFRGAIAIFTDISAQKELEREVLRAVIRTQESERKRFAKDLHDGIGQILSASKMQLYSLEEASEESRSELIPELRSMIENAIDETRNITHDLMPNELRDFGLVKACENLLERVWKSKGVEVHLEKAQEELRLGEDLQIASYRILQEAVNNAVKHSGASELRAGIEAEAEALHLWVQDNGVGFERDQEEQGIGTANMRRRAELFGGSIDIRSEKDRGTLVEVRLPLKGTKD